MEISECKSIVQSFFEEAGNFLTHQNNEQLVFNQKKYRIQPDDTYIFPQTVITIEYENTRRPVESVSKYWWLFLKTDWLTNSIRLKCCLFVLRGDLNEIRKESLIILGEELVSKYPMAFEFKYLTPDQISEKKIRSVLKNMFDNANCI